jgi:Flp pilus assembly protein TadD
MSDPAAIQRWQQLLQSQPDHDLARFSLGKAFFDAGRHAEAREAFRTALERKPDWMVVRILLGKCHLSLGDRTEARAEFARALQLAIDQDHNGPRAEMEQVLADLDADGSG